MKLLREQWRVGVLRPYRQGGLHSCAIYGHQGKQGVQFWGNAEGGQLDGTVGGERSRPVLVDAINDRPTGVKLMSVHAAFEHSCVAIDGYGIICWGNVSDNKLGEGVESSDSFSRVGFDLKDWVGLNIEHYALDSDGMLDIKYYHSCSVASLDGKDQKYEKAVWCWGRFWLRITGRSQCMVLGKR